MFQWLKTLFAAISNAQTEFPIVDPTAVGDNKVRNITLAFIPSEQEDTATISLYWSDSQEKVFEKDFDNSEEAQEVLASLTKDLQEAAQLTKENKIDVATNLVKSLLSKYSINTGDLIQQDDMPFTMTNASLDKEALWKDKLQSVYSGDFEAFQAYDEMYGLHQRLGFESAEEAWETNPTVQGSTNPADYKVVAASLGKIAKAQVKNVFQTITFDSPEELMQYQEKMKSLQPQKEETSPLDDLEKAPDSLEDAIPNDEDEIGTPSLSYEDAEKQDAEQQKNITKRIEQEVKEQINSQLEQKIATSFSDKDEKFVEGMKAVGRTWEEIRDYMIKELKYDKDSVAAYIDQKKAKEDGMVEPKEVAPEAPKPPHDLVSPETHEKLLDEITPEKEIDKKDEKPVEETPKEESKEIEEISQQDVTEIRKVAKEINLNAGYTIVSSYTGASANTLFDSPELSFVDHWIQNDQLTVVNVPGRELDFVISRLDQVAKEGDTIKIFEGDMIDNPLAEGWNQARAVAAGLKAYSLHKVADEPLETRPNNAKPMGNVENFPKTEFPNPEDKPENDPIEFPGKDNDQQPVQDFERDDRVFVMGDETQGQQGFEGKFIGEYKSKGDQFAWVMDDHEQLHEVPLHMVQPVDTHTQAMKSELAAIQAEIKQIEASINEDGTPDANDIVETYINGNISDAREWLAEQPELFQEALELMNQYAPKDARRFVELVKPQRIGGAPDNVSDEEAADAADFMDTHKESAAAPFQPYQGQKGFDVDPRWGEDFAVAPWPCSCGVMIKTKNEGLSHYRHHHGRSTSVEQEAAFVATLTKVAAPPTVPDPAETKFKDYKISPPETKEKQPELANPEVASAVREFNETKAFLEQLESDVKAIQARANAEVAKLREERGQTAAAELYQQRLDKLASLVRMSHDKVVEVEDNLFTLSEGVKHEPYKPTHKELLDKVVEHFKGAKEYLQNVINGMQNQATDKSFSDLIRSPKRKSSFSLSKIDKTADALDILDAMYSQMVKAWEQIKAATAPFEAEVPAAASLEVK